MPRLKGKNTEVKKMTNFIQTMENKYQQLDSLYVSSPLLIKLLIAIGVAAILLAIGSTILPIVYKSGQDFGEFLYNHFGSK